MGENAPVSLRMDPSAPRRGHLKVFIGMAAGVGKTYRMLQEGRSEAETGRDVAIGYLEPHGREETDGAGRDLEEIPPRMVDYRGTPLAEMDLPAVLARKPELCLIDELAHTNAPGTEHEKRYEDVQDVLDAGIDVYLDRQRAAPGEPQRPDHPAHGHARARDDPRRSARRRRRGRADRPHARGADRAPARRQGVSARARAGGAQQLLQDREPLGVARDRAAPRRRGRGDQAAGAGWRRASDPAASRRRASPPERVGAGAGTQAIAERLLALVALAPHSQRIVRRAARSAERLGARLDVLVVRPSERTPSAEDREQLESLRRLTAMLGARLLVEEGEDVAAVAIETARRLGSTYVLIGSPGARRGLGRLASRSSCACSTGCPGSTCGSWPTLRCARTGAPRPRVGATEPSGSKGSPRGRMPRRSVRSVVKDRWRSATSPSIGCCNEHDSHTFARHAPLPARHSGWRCSSSSPRLPCGRRRRRRVVQAARPRLLVVSDRRRRPADRDVHESAVAAAAHQDRALHRSLRRGRAALLAATGASWIAAAEADHQQVLVAFYHSEYTPTKMPSVSVYQRDVKKFLALFPKVKQYQAWNEANRGTIVEVVKGRRHVALVSPSATAVGSVLQGAEVSLPRLHDDRPRHPRRPQREPQLALHRRIQAHDHAPQSPDAHSCGACTTTPTPTASRAPAHARS